MSLGTLVDVVLGLMLCYLLLGLIGSALLEALAGGFNLRGAQLARGLRRLLAASGAQPHALFERVYRHALVAPEPRQRAPAYIARHAFSTALLDVLAGGGAQRLSIDAVAAGIERLPPGPARQALAALLAQAPAELPALRSAIERWFDEAMDRASGDYKRFTNHALLAFGLVAALGAHLDSATLARAVWAERAACVAVGAPDAAAALSAAAVGGAGHAPVGDRRAASASTAVTSPSAAAARGDTALPIGWGPHDRLDWRTLLGCLVTALATSVGAPFWFDTLGKFLRVRVAAPRPPGG
jgi:hypothetical protein